MFPTNNTPPTVELPPQHSPLTACKINAIVVEEGASWCMNTHGPTRDPLIGGLSPRIGPLLDIIHGLLQTPQVQYGTMRGKLGQDTVDGRNPAPPSIAESPRIMGFCPPINWCRILQPSTVCRGKMTHLYSFSCLAPCGC